MLADEVINGNCDICVDHKTISHFCSTLVEALGNIKQVYQ